MRSVKWLLIFLCAFTSGPFLRAGAFSWLTKREVNWRYIQQTGGLKIAQPIMRDGQWMLPVEYEVHGTRAVTSEPTVVNSAPHTWKAKIVRQEMCLHLIVVVALAGPREELRSLREASLEDVPAGRYAVFYGRVVSADCALGEIEIPAREPSTSRSR